MSSESESERDDDISDNESDLENVRIGCHRLEEAITEADEFLREAELRCNYLKNISSVLLSTDLPLQRGFFTAHFKVTSDVPELQIKKNDYIRYCDLTERMFEKLTEGNLIDKSGNIKVNSRLREVFNLPQIGETESYTMGDLLAGLRQIIH